MYKLLLVHGHEVPRGEIEGVTDEESLKLLVAKYRHLIPDEAIGAVAGKLGSHLVGCHLTVAQRAKGRAKANDNKRRKAVETYEDLVPEIRARRAAGDSLAKVAAWLNESGERRPSGKPWSKAQVKRLLDRAAC